MMYATMKQRTDWIPAVRHKRSQNAGVVWTLAEEVVPVDVLMRISFRTESDATRGIIPEQNIRGFRPNECCDVGLSELEAMSVLGGPRLRAGDVSALSEARFQEELCTGTMVRRAFDKAVRRKPPVVAADAGPYGNSIEGRCGVEMRRGCAGEHDRRQRKMKR